MCDLGNQENSTVEVIDEHTLGYRVRMKWPLSAFVDESAAARVHEKLVENPDFCRLFSTPMTDFEQIRSILVDSDGNELSTVVVDRSECAKR